MFNRILPGLILLLVAQSGAMAETVIIMPVPPQAASGASVANAGQAMNASSGLFAQGIEALDRYSTKSGRPRHQYSVGWTGSGTSSRFRPRQFYSSYQGPLWGWGWGGSPIFVNNYWCGQPASGRGLCRDVGFTGIAVGF